MGIKNVADLVQLNPSYPDALNPTRKNAHIVPVQVTRTMTSATKVAVLPADATIIAIFKYIQTASNAGTTATVTFAGNSTGPGGPGALAFGSDNVLAAGGSTGFITTPTVNFVNGIFTLERAPATQTMGDQVITATYAETGTASSTGGPFNYLILYVR